MATAEEGAMMSTSSTGGMKQTKPERYDLIPPAPLAALARLYGYGAKKYTTEDHSGAHNWRAGYEWSKSFAAMQRHAWAFWGGETLDPESEQPHMASVAFHAFALLQYAQDFPQFDDRYVADAAWADDDGTYFIDVCKNPNCDYRDGDE